MQASINKYESKGSVAIFFAGKATYEQNQRDISETNRNIQNKLESLHQKEELLSDYQKQLSDLRLLQEKRQAVTPTKTIRYWTEEEQRLRQALSEIKDKLIALEGQGNRLISEIAHIELAKKNNQDFFDSFACAGLRFLSWLSSRCMHKTSVG